VEGCWAERGGGVGGGDTLNSAGDNLKACWLLIGRLRRGDKGKGGGRITQPCRNYGGRNKLQ
jgi:hypothetical protein